MPLNYNDLMAQYTQGFANAGSEPYQPQAPQVGLLGGAGGGDWRAAAPQDFNAMAGGLLGGPYQAPPRSVDFRMFPAQPLPAPAPTPGAPIQGGLIPGVSPGVPNIGAPDFGMPVSMPPYFGPAPIGPGAGAIPPVESFPVPTDPPVNAADPNAFVPSNPWIPDWMESLGNGIGNAFSNTGFGPNHGTGIGTGVTWEGLGGDPSLGNGVVDPNIGGINPDSARNAMGGRGSLGFGFLNNPRVR
jgi:hypothetical protein